MKKSGIVLLALVATLALAGCKDRVLWNDNGKVEEATSDREVWNTQGDMDSGERKIWNDREDDPVVE